LANPTYPRGAIQTEAEAEKPRSGINAGGMVLKSLHAAPSIAAFVENSPQGRGRDAARFSRGWEAPSKNPREKREAQEFGGVQGGLFFGYLLLAKQKKVSRLSGRDPTSKKASRSVTLFKTPQFESHPYPSH